jgi:hypothetical protein
VKFFRQVQESFEELSLEQSEESALGLVLVLALEQAGGWVLALVLGGLGWVLVLGTG